MARLPVESPEGQYDIWIEPRLFEQVKARATEFGLNRRTAVVTNTTLAPLYGEALTAALPDAALVVMPDGEAHKNLDTVASLYSEFVKAGLDRSSVVIALGGGVVGDTAGFAAATYMRGISLVQMPTSLLAMVDSSVGGKVGVDLPQGKNLVGAFKQPECVLIDPDMLATLPTREYRCGLAEMIKHGLLADALILEKITDALAGNLLDMPMLIERAVQVKINVVQSDPYEKGARAHLNLGHTFAHAFEQVSGYAIPHGEAVAVGLAAALRLSARLEYGKPELVGQIEALLRGVGLPVRASGLDAEAVYAAMATDKKWRAGKSRFILLKRVGEPVIVEDVPPGEVMAVLAEVIE
jgi:shikimate kinase/3-dehydroquinate synthase